MPLNWKTPRPSHQTRNHLPVDPMAHLTRPLLGGLWFAPLINSSLSPHLTPLPPESVIKAAYSSLKAKACLLMLDDWRLDHPPPPYYSFLLSLTPHPFMGLGKFMAGRIHQMRAQKSYLAAHPSWSSSDASRRCPLGAEEQETFSHAVLRCPAKAAARWCHLQGLTSVGPHAPLWSLVPLLASLAAFIKATATNYPPDMFPHVPHQQKNCPAPCCILFTPSPGRSRRS